MEGQESNEEEEAVLDYRTPKGQLIQFVEQKLKKPEIDDSLGKVLDKFQELTREQTTYLDIGIFHMNFTEDALLIQCCGQLYGKRVDKLWEELLQFHTRMVKYDEKSVKNSGDIEKIKSTKQEIAKLEERLNRGKRKKIVLADPELETQTQPGLSGEKFYLINFDQSEFQSFAPDNRTFPLAKDDDEEEEEPPAFEYEAYEDWDTFNTENKRELSQNFKSQLVMEYNKIGCRFKPYPSPFFNEMIYDLSEPDLYNTKEGKLISCQLIRQMFEDNDNCLIPDENFVIARLRIAHSVKNKWLLQNKIDPTDYDSYKVAWQKYKREFFAKERRKIQNMPQKSKEDAIRFFEALKKKEQIAREKVQKLEEMGVKDLPAISFYTVIVEPLREDYDGIFDPYIPEGFEVPGVPGEHDLDDPALDEIDEIRDGDPQTALVSDQLNQTGDSGFVPDLDETDHEEPNKSVAEGTATPFEEDASRNRDETPSLNHEGATSSIPGTSTPFSENENDITDPNESADANVDPSDSFDDIKLFMSSQGDDNVKIVSDAQREEMNNAIKEFVQHNESLYRTLENSYFEKTDDLIAIFYDKPVIETAKLQKRLPKKKDIVTQEQKEKGITMKRKLENSSKEDETVPKRRKLSKRQVEKLKRSLIIPVNELKWDSFHSHNYQPEAEEGEISRIDYISDTEDEDTFEHINEEKVNELSHIETKNNEDLEEPLQLTQDSGIDITMNATQEESQLEAILNDTIAEVQHVDERTAAPETLTNIPDINHNINVLDDRAKTPVPSFGDKERERHEMRVRVEEWRQYITPKLKSLEEQDFDIHEYSANIINSIEINETKPFAEIISGKSSTEVVRYFISSLQLANTLNVEICGAARGQLANDTFQLKLLNKEQYHEHLQEYQAPSEENFREKLKKIKEIQKQKEALTQKKQHTKRRTQSEDEEFHPQANFMPQSQKLTIKSKSARVISKKKLKISKQNNIEFPFNNSQASNSSRNQGFHLQQPSTSRQADLADQTRKHQQPKRRVQKEDQEYQPEEESMRPRQKLTIKRKSQVNFNNNIQILNYDIRSPPSQQDNSAFSLDCPQTSKSSSVCQGLDFEQSSTSWQADLADEQSFVDSAISDMDRTPARSSFDSGFNASCDEDFLEEFDQLQQISDSPITSTPYPYKVLKIKLVKHKSGFKPKNLRINLEQLDESSY